jgi:putative PEP-CTERM system TPR-repeat lipoprotein
MRTGAPSTDVQAMLERAVKANPPSSSARIALINYQLGTGNKKAALETAETASAASPDDLRLLDLLGVAQQANGATNQAISTFNKLATLRPSSQEPLMRLAAVHVASKNYDAAIAALRKAVALKPDQVKVRAELAMVELAAGKSDDALAEARAIQKDFPTDALGYALEGELHFARNEYPAASSAFRQGLKRQSSGFGTARLHASLSREGKTSDAASLVTAWLKNNPKDVVVRTYLGDRSLAQKDYKGAMNYYQEVIMVQPGNVAVLNNLAWVADQLNDPAATGYAEKAYAAAPANPSIKDTYGWILFKKGDVKRAVELLTEAASAAPKSPEIRLHLAKALLESGDKVGARREVEAIVQMDPAPPQRAEAEDLLKKL